MTYPAELKARRMAEDAAKIQNMSTWPMGRLLPLKTQPWVTEANKTMRFARIFTNALPIDVYEDGGNEPVTFDSIEELVEIWSVD